MKIPETSWLHVLWRKCRTCSYSLPLIFTLVAARISHFFTAATKFSLCSSNKWLVISHSSSLSLFFSLSVAGLSPTSSFSLPFSFSIFQICRHDNWAFNSSLGDSNYDCKTQQNATLTGQEEEGDVQLKVSYLCLVIFWLLDYFSSWEFRRLIPFCPSEYQYIDTHYVWPPVVVSTSQDADGYAISRQNNLELHLGYHTCSSYFASVCLWCGRTADGRTVTWIVYHLQEFSGKSGSKVNGTRLFGSSQRKISGSNGTSEKVVLFFRTKYSKRKFVFHFLKAIFDTSLRPSLPFSVKWNWSVQMVNAIPELNLPVLNFAYHLSKP